MGAVKFETRNEGRGLREWDYVPLSEPRVVAKLIQTRWKVDESYYPLLEQSANPLISNGVFPFSEPVLCTYIDLDMLIEETELTSAEEQTVNYLMRGYSMSDIAECCGTTSGHVLRLLKSAA